MSKSRFALSVVTPCYNDHSNLRHTMESLGHELTSSDEWIVVDSSSAAGETKRILGKAELACPTRYIWIAPKGVYSAQNLGICEAKGEWIQVINAGDAMAEGGRDAIAGAVSRDTGARILVFAQRARDANGEAYVFRPTDVSVWPHQSIVVHREVYATHGLYDEGMRYSSEQKYFADVRRVERWSLNEFVLSDYLLGGISSRVNPRQIRESYLVRRALGQGQLRSLACSLVLPSVRRTLECFLGQSFTNRVKLLLFGHYYKS